jgi:hypothetical protein
MHPTFSASICRTAARALFLLLLTAAVVRAADMAAAKQLYTCSMHPQILLDHPGNCPICSMKLVPVMAVAKPHEHHIKYYQSSMNPGEVSQAPGKDSMGMDLVPVYENDAEDAVVITVAPEMIQKMNLKTDVVRKGPVRREIRAVGAVEFDEQGLRDVTTKYEGWIEKLIVNTTWARVRTGDPLFEIYSPDLYNAQLNYLIAVRSEGANSGPLTHAAYERLRLFDVPEGYIRELARNGEAHRTYIYPSPADGVVMEKAVVQGTMVKPGEKILRLASLATVWVNAQIYEQDLAFVHAGQEARVRSTFGGDRETAARIDSLLPEVDATTRTTQARLILPNLDFALKPGMFVEVRIASELSPSSVLVPDMAVLRSGERTTVFIARPDGAFEPREVKLGAATGNDTYEVLSGLTAGERIVTSGQFLLDSESQLREAIQKMLK